MITLRTFTPAEAAKATGINATLQRDWRRRGILPKTEGHARFSIFEIGEMMALQALSVISGNLQQYRGVARMLGAAVCYEALTKRAAYSGDFASAVNIHTPFREEIAPHIEHRMLEIMGGQLSEAHLDEIIDAWKIKGLRRLAMKQAGYRPEKMDTCFVHWADGSFGFVGTMMEPYETVDDNDPRRRGAVLMLDGQPLASLLIERVGALAEIDIDTGSSVWARNLRERQEELAVVRREILGFSEERGAA